MRIYFNSVGIIVHNLVLFKYLKHHCFFSMLRIDFGARLQQFSLIALILGLKKMNTLNSHLLSALLMKKRL